MQTDGRYMLANNYRYSMVLLRHCQDNDIPFIYASSAAVYGAGRESREESAAEAPLNVYGYSKLLFDQHVRRTLPERTAQIAGFRYFNVYGPREAHKGRMASVVWHFFNQYRASGKVQLFEGSGGYAAGEQRRDFISVDDVIKVNLDFLDHPQRSGIFCSATCTAASQRSGRRNDQCLPRGRRRAGAVVRRIASHRSDRVHRLPAGLASRYQSFTQADLGRLRAAGYTAPMATIEQGVANYVRSLLAAADVNP
jgi:ADP-L-glycero-D-manno-heptose 6-epimerase